MLYIVAYGADISNTLLSDVCGPLIKMSPADITIVDKAFSLLNTAEGELDFKLIISTLIV